MSPCCCFDSSCFPLAKSEGLQLLFNTLSVSAEHASCTYVELDVHTSKRLRMFKSALPPLVLRDLIFSLPLKAKGRTLLVWE